MDKQRNYAWVTHAKAKEECEQALRLGNSFRKVNTVGSLILLLHSKLDLLKTFRAELESVFDFVFVLAPPTEGCALKENINNEFITAVKLHCLSLSWLDKCIIIPSNTTAKKNPDGLFFATQDKNAMVFTNKNEQLLLIKPSESKLKTLLCKMSGVEKEKSEDKAYLDEIIDLDEDSFGISLNNPFIVRTGSSDLKDPTSKDQYDDEKDPIAVVGMACRLPSANSIFEFWNLLENGTSGIIPPPPHRWMKHHHPYFPPGVEKTQAGFLTSSIDGFDAKFFEISPKEAVAMDPQHRLLLEVAWESLENAGINPQELKGAPGGVFLGTWQNDYKEIVQLDQAASEHFRVYKGNCVGAAAAKISHLLGWTGPNIGSESDCAAGLHSVHMASKSLQSGECNIALACAVNLIVKPFSAETFFPFVVSPDFKCKTFDDEANGFARGEGCGVLVLKRYSDAVKDKNKIWGLIRGTGISQEGLTPSMGTPTVNSQVLAMKRALIDANILPNQVSYLEAHGTATQVGDVVEMEAIKEVYGNSKRKEPLIIGCVKTNFGHTESCSGIAGIIKVILSMWKEVIPAHLNFKKFNEKINLEGMNILLPLENVYWSGKNKRIAAISSYGMAGKNAHLILEEAPQMSELKQAENSFGDTFQRPLHLLKITAKSKSALKELLHKYENMLQQEQKMNIADVIYAANTGRASFSQRAAIIAGNWKDKYEIVKSSGTHGVQDICFLFTGQGSQYHKMAFSLYQTSPVFKINFDFCHSWLESRYGVSLKKAYFNEENKESVNKTLLSQTGIFAVEYSLMKLWRSWGVKPKIVVGHSLGEFCAGVCAGILTVEDALLLVAERSRLIEEKVPLGRMLAVKADFKTVQDLQNELFGNLSLDYAAFNTEEQTVVAGCPQKIEKLQEFLQKKETKSTLVQSSHAFHSRDMEPILEKYRKVAELVKYKRSRDDCIYVSGMLGKIIEGGEINAEYWTRHTSDPVNFLAACDVIAKICSVCLEIGPHPVLSAMMMGNCKKEMICLPSLRRNADDWKIILLTAGKLFVEAGIELDWEGMDKDFVRKNVAYHLPTYPFQRTSFWPRIPSGVLRQPKPVHPLIGHSLQIPTKTVVFQNQLSLEALPYLKGHMLGDTIIFPGAGYIEMLLAAGATSLFGNDFKLYSKTLGLKRLQIQAPLPLYEDTLDGEWPTCQTVIELGKENEVDEEGIHAFISQKVFAQEDLISDTCTWTHHASAIIFNNPEKIKAWVEEFDMKNVLDPDRKININLIERIQSCTKEENFEDSFYKKCDQIGLNLFGLFRTLKKVWRNFESGELLAEIEVPVEPEKYILHPIVIDAMLQVAAYPHCSAEFNKMETIPFLVSVGLKQFIWFKSVQGRCFIYSSKPEANSAALFTEEGELAALLLKAEVVETTLKNVQGMLSGSKSLPEFYNFEWQEKISASPKPHVDFQIAPDGVDIFKKATPQILTASKITPEEIQRKKDTHRLATLYIIKALNDLGFHPDVKRKIKLSSVFNNIGISENHWRITKRFLSFLVEDGFITREIINGEGEEEWLITKVALPSNTEFDWEINSILERNLPRETINGGPIPLQQVPIVILKLVGEKLCSFLKGEDSPLPILFPKDPSNISAARYYEFELLKIKEIFKTLLCQHWTSLKSAYETQGEAVPTLRILEVGAGTGVATVQVLESLKQANFPFEYVYTDVSSSFFSAAEEKFKEFGGIKFKKLNIEEDPTSQGFPPGYFDVVVACHVLHVARDIKEALLHVRQVMVDGGNLWMSEDVGIDRMSNCIFGLLDGYWKFQDFQLRPDHCMLPAKKWKEVTMEMGFSEFHHIQDKNEGVIACRADHFGRLKSSPNNLLNKLEYKMDVKRFPVWIVFYGEDDEDLTGKLETEFNILGRKRTIFVKLCEKTFHNRNDFVQKAYELKTTFNIPTANLQQFWKQLFEQMSKDCVIFEGIIIALGFSQEQNQNKISKSYLSLIQELLQLPKTQIPSKCVILTNGQFPVEGSICRNPSASTLIGMTITALNESKDVKLRMIDLDSESPILSREVFHEIFCDLDEKQDLICAYRSGRKYFPKFTKSKPMISSLALDSSLERFQLSLHPSKLIQNLKFEPLQFFPIKKDEIEVKVLYSGLNFLDLFSVLKPNKIFEGFNQVGFDYGGVVTQVGKSVSRWKVGDSVFGMNFKKQPMPSYVTAEEDAVEKAPFGFTCAEIACLPAVFATSYESLITLAKAKKGDTLLIHVASGGVGLVAIQIAKYLGLNIICTAGSERKRNYLKSLGIPHVFNSRTTHFSQQTLDVTGGKGVDIVLNSLTGPGFKEATLAACANGARFVEMGKMNIWTEKEVFCQRPDVKYFVIDISHPKEVPRLKKLTHTLVQWIDSGRIVPIPFTRFDVVDIRQALNYLQTAQQIGKVVCAMPDGRGKYVAGDQHQAGRLFNKTSTYLITGGLGGIGLQVCRYMLEQGAGSIVLFGRNGPSDEASSILENLKKLHPSSKITVLQGDVGSFEDLQKVFAYASKNLPPIRGVMHAAGVISDGVLENLCWENFCKVFRSKFEGSWNLHELTKDLILEHFVLFSSFASKFGTLGQAAYVAACSFQDAFAHFRNSQGLPATVINWGQSGDVGVAKDLEVLYVNPFTLDQGINALDEILRKNINSVTIANLKPDLASFIKNYRYLKWVIDPKILNSSKNPKTNSQKSILTSATFWAEYDDCGEYKGEIVKKYVDTMLKFVLRMSPDEEKITEDLELSTLGMDSLSMIELCNLMESICGKKAEVNRTAIRECRTFKALFDEFMQITESTQTLNH